MAIVTISRGSASGGLLLAQGLAERLGYQFISREEIIKGASKFGVTEAYLEKALLRPPEFSEDFKHNIKTYLTFVQEALCERAEKDNIIYLGHAAHLLLRGISHVLRIRLIASHGYRTRTLVERDGITEEEAAAYIDQVDAQRRAWTLLLYGVDWLSPSHYDLTINLETLNIESAIEIAAAAVNRPEFTTTDQSRKAVKDLLLESRVRAALTQDAIEGSADIQVLADSVSGRVLLKGEVKTSAMMDEMVRVAGEVAGAEKVDGSGLSLSETPE
jgi:cytidylate kinase